MELDQKNLSEEMCDIGGQTLAPDAESLLRALDKLLTLGAYYSQDHSQYLAASEEAAQSMAKAIRPRSKITLEITAEGLLILEQTLNPRLRHVHQIHDLLVPLNIARLDIQATLTGADLRLAVKVLAEHLLKYGQTQSFQEIIIEGLPPSIQTVSIQVLAKSGQDEGEDPADLEDNSGLSDVRQMVEDWGRSAGDTQTEELAREFMDMVTAILNNLGHQYSADGVAEDEPGGGLSLTPVEVRQLRDSFQRLVEVNPSPQVLTRLITHARAALDLSRDTVKADLVFQTLRRGLQDVHGAEKTSRPESLDQTEYAWDLETLKQKVNRLEQEGPALPPMPSGAPEAHLGICLSLLRSDPPETMRHTLEETLVDLFQQARAGESILKPCRQAVLDALESGYTEWVDELLVSLTKSLRRGKTSLLGEFWAGLKPKVHATDLLVLWPHLVNDILQGLGRVDGQTGREVLLWAGSLTPGTAQAQLDRLEPMPAVQAENASGDVFKAPLPAMYSVLNCLAQTSLSPWLSQGLYRTLKSHPTSALTKALMGAVDFDPQQLDFYLEIVAIAGGQEMSSQFRDKAAFLLLGILTDLPQVRREEEWVKPALVGLAELKVDSARPLFTEIVEARRLLMLKAWPEACRQVAIRALKEPGKQHG